MKKDKAESKIKQFLIDHKDLILVFTHGKLRHVDNIDNVTLERNTTDGLRVGIIAGGFYRVYSFTELHVRKVIKDYVNNILNQVN